MTGRRGLACLGLLAAGALSGVAGVAEHPGMAGLPPGVPGERLAPRVAPGLEASPPRTGVGAASGAAREARVDRGPRAGSAFARVSARERATVSQGDRSADEPAGGATRIRVERPEATAVAPLGALRGRDPGGPRWLGVWRLAPAGRAPVRIAEGWSDPDGALRLERLLLPAVPARLVVAPLERGPEAPEASAPVAWPGRAPAPLQAQWGAGGRDPALDVYVAPGATLLVSPADALSETRLRGVRAGPRGSLGMPVAPLRAPLPPRRGGWIVAQELPDGRRSRWSPVVPDPARPSPELPADRSERQEVP